MTTQEYIAGVQSAMKLLEGKSIEKATAICKELIQRMPGRSGAYNLLAQILIKQDELAQAEDILMQGAVHAGDKLLHLNLGVVRTQLKKHQEPVATFEKVEIKKLVAPGEAE